MRSINGLLLSLARFVPDELYLRMVYRMETGKRLHLKAPHTFNEKLQWLKLHNRKPIFTQMVDKVSVRDIVAERIGPEYLVPMLGVWDSVDDIDFQALPDKFVLKCTHDSGDLVICKDKQTLDIDAAKEKLKKGLATDLYTKGREWPYKNVRPRVYGEVYLSDSDSDQLTDYKVYCFNAVPHMIQVDIDRFTDHKRQFYSPDWSLTDVSWHIPSTKSAKLAKPSVLNEMLEISTKLSDGIPFLRVDFYVVGDKLYIGETTFFPGAGFGKWAPEGTDERLGNLLKIQ